MVMSVFFMVYVIILARGVMRYYGVERIRKIYLSIIVVSLAYAIHLVALLIPIHYAQDPVNAYRLLGMIPLSSGRISDIVHILLLVVLITWGVYIYTEE